jgi:ATPases involved in chromosome partitioning
MRIVTIYNKKGGTGKTSLATNIAANLAAAGYHVGMLDGDEQANTSTLTAPHRYGRPTLTHVVCENIPLRDAMYQARRNLWIVPADMNLSRAVEYIHAQQDFEVLCDRIEDLQKALSALPEDRSFPWRNLPEVRLRDFNLIPTTAEEFRTPPDYLDFLVMDNPPNPNALTTAMLFAAQEVIVPVELEQYAYQGLAQMFEDIGRKFKRRQQQMKIAGIVPMRVDHRGALTVDYLSSVWRMFPALTTFSVHTDKTIPNAQTYNKVSFEEDRTSRGAKELFALALSLTGWQGKVAGLEPCKNCAAAREIAQKPEEA